jgi:hypothetical protein
MAKRKDRIEPMVDRSGNDRYRGQMSGRMAEVMGHASPVYSCPTSECSDCGRMKPMKQGTRGYAEQAWEYQY